jgi:hypothetical protein
MISGGAAARSSGKVSDCRSFDRPAVRRCGEAAVTSPQPRTVSGQRVRPVDDRGGRTEEEGGAASRR